MRVAIHAEPATHRIPGGVGAYVTHLVRELLRSEDEWEYRLVLGRRCLKPDEWEVTDSASGRVPVWVRYALWNYLAIPRLGEPLDIVHATGLVIPATPKAKLVATVHDLAVEKLPSVVPPLWRAIYKRGLHVALSRAEVLCAVSEAIKQELLERFDFDERRIVVTPEAATLGPEDPRDEHILQRLGLEGPYILSVGTVEPRKNQTMLVRAFDRISEQLEGMKLAIVGAPGWGQQQVEEQISRLDLQERVVLTGAVTASELAALFSGAFVFALPSMYEGFGIPLLEALSFGIPSVATSIPALEELGGQAALYVESGEVDQLAEALSKLALDTALRVRLSSAGPQQAARFSWKTTASRTREAYRLAVSQVGGSH